MSGLLIEGARLLDLASGEFHPATSVRVEGDRIVEVSEPGVRLTAPDDVVRLDAGGRTLLPGFIDAHVHAAITTMDLAAMGRRSPMRIGIEAKTILERMLRRGFTTVRDAGGPDVGFLEDGRGSGVDDLPIVARVLRSQRVRLDVEDRASDQGVAAEAGHASMPTIGRNAVPLLGRLLGRDGRAIEQEREIVGCQGVFNMSPTNHNGMDERARVLVTVKDGRFRLLPE